MYTEEFRYYISTAMEYGTNKYPFVSSTLINIYSVRIHQSRHIYLVNYNITFGISLSKISFIIYIYKMHQTNDRSKLIMLYGHD